MKGNLKTEKKKEKGYIFLPMVINMTEIGKIIKKKEKEYIIIKMGIDMREIITMIKKKEKEFFIIVMEIEKWEISKMGNKLESMSNFNIIKKQLLIVIGILNFYFYILI